MIGISKEAPRIVIPANGPTQKTTPAAAKKAPQAPQLPPAKKEPKAQGPKLQPADKPKPASTPSELTQSLTRCRTQDEVITELSRLPAAQQQLLALELVERGLLLSKLTEVGDPATRAALLASYDALLSASDPKTIAAAVGAVAKLTELARPAGAKYFSTKLVDIVTYDFHAFLLANDAGEVQKQLKDHIIAKSGFMGAERQALSELLDKVDPKTFASVGYHAFVGQLNDFKPADKVQALKDSVQAVAEKALQPYFDNYLKASPLSVSDFSASGRTTRALVQLMDLGMLASEATQQAKTLAQFAAQQGKL